MRDKMNLPMAASQLATMTGVYRHHWSGNHAPYQDLVASPIDDKEHMQLSEFEPLFRMIGVTDGDEIEISVRKTGRRPFGDRRVILQRSGTYGPETDEQNQGRLNPTKHECAAERDALACKFCGGPVR